MLWEGYIIDYYNVVVTSKTNVLVHNITERVELTEFIFVNEYSLPVCTELEFSISAVNENYGESDGTVIIGEFDTGSK